ncbi:hypothetical protein GBAR_LOCUS15686, partial [Geodia barretti]
RGQWDVHCVILCQSKELARSGEVAVSVLEDVSLILCSPRPLSRCSAPHALSDLQRLLSSAADELHSVKESKKDIKLLKMGSKKVYFLTVWALENVVELQCLARLVDIEHAMVYLKCRSKQKNMESCQNSL